MLEQIIDQRQLSLLCVQTHTYPTGDWFLIGIQVSRKQLLSRIQQDSKARIVKSHQIREGASGWTFQSKRCNFYKSALRFYSVSIYLRCGDNVGECRISVDTDAVFTMFAKLKVDVVFYFDSKIFFPLSIRVAWRGGTNEVHSPQLVMADVEKESMKNYRIASEKINPEASRYPYCIVWTPIPVLSWVIAFWLNAPEIARGDSSSLAS